MAKKIEAVLELDTKQAERGINKVSGALKALVSVAAAQEIFRFGNELQEIQNKLRAVSGSSAEASRNFDLVASIADRTRSGLGETTDLFFRLTKASENLGLTGAETARITELFAKTLKNSGATATEAQSAILQFGQAMASGKLAGDEFRSINETNSALMDVLADAIGRPRGELKDLASQGKLTGEILASAILESADVIENDFGKTTTTLSDALTAIRNNVIVLFENIEAKTGIFQKLANAISLLGDNINFIGVAIAYAFGSAAVGAIAQGVVMFNRVAKAIRGAAGAAAILQAVTGIGALKALGGLAAGTAAALAMESALGDAADESALLNGELKDMDGPPQRAAGSTQQLFENTEATVTATKDLNEQLKERERILARQLEDFNAITGELRIQREEFVNNLQLQTDMLGASDRQKTLLQAQADIEEDRAEALRDLNDLTLIDAEERKQKEDEINAEYDDRLDKMGKFLSLSERVKQMLSAFSIGQTAFSPINDANEQLKLQQDIINASSVAEREAIQKNFELMAGVRKAEQDLELKIAKDIAENRAKLGRNLTEQEVEAIRNRYAYETAVNADLRQQTQALADAYLERFGKMRDATRSFAVGFGEAFENFRDMVENEAEYGQRIFDTMAQGWTDAIVQFAETGKLSFKSLFKALLIEIIKMQANKMFLAIFGEGGPLGSIMSIFTGKKKHGGFIPAGKFGIAGEAGAEIVSGPAHVTSTADTAKMLGGSQQVTYNINAVDAMSFKQMVARDPEFIFNVTQAGARRIPS